MQQDIVKTNRLLAAGFLIVVVAVLIGGGLMLYKKGVFSNTEMNTNINNVDSSSNQSVNAIDTADWVPYPYFSDSINFYLFIPSEWTTPSLEQIYGSYVDEGSFLWFQPHVAVNDQSVSISIGKYRDTGQDLATWTRLESKEIESSRVASTQFENYTYNDIPMIEICSDGTIGGTPAPACFVYMHQGSWIIELRIETYTSSSYDRVKQLARAYSSQFNFINDTSTWSEYYSFNNGFKLHYPDDVLPLDTLLSRLVTSFHAESSDKIFQIAITHGATADLEKYWYDVQKNEIILTSKFPNEIYVDGQRCFSYVLQTEGEKIFEIQCKVYNTLYKIQMMPGGDKAGLLAMLDMLSSLTFTTNNVVNNDLTIFKEDSLFQLTYPNTYAIYEEGYDSTYLSFFESGSYAMPRRGFSISFQKTDKSVETCTNDMNCFLYGINLSLYNQTTLRGESAVVRGYDTQYDIQNTQTTTNYIFTKNGMIYSINVFTIGTVGNDEVNAILKSFSFM
ncbi:MAG: hypothetical protein V1668_02745 [Patescibacteria group bacterium]